MADEIEKNEKAEYEAKKEYLRGYLRACRRIDNLKEQLESLREVEQSAKSQQLSDMPRGGGSGQQDLSVLMTRLEELRAKINDAMAESNKIKLEIEETLWTLKNTEEAKVLRLRYIYFMKWEEIAKNTGYSERQARRIHKRAINNLKMSANVRFKCDII